HAVRLRQRFSNREAEAQTAKSALKRAVALFKRVENTLYDFWFHPDTGIAQTDAQDVLRGIGRRDQDLAILRCELDRILEQVPDDLLKLCRVCRDEMRICPQVEMHRKSFGCGLRAANLYDI